MPESHSPRSRRRLTLLVLSFAIGILVLIAFGVPRWWCFALAESNLRENRTARAATWIERGERLGKPEPRGALLSVLLELSRNRVLKAGEHLRAAVERGGSKEVVNAYGYLIAAHGGDESAVERMSLLPSGVVPIAAAYRGATRCSMYNGRFDVAMATAQQWRDALPDDAAAHYHLGRLYELTGQPEQSASAYRSSLARQPEFAPASFRLGVLLREQGEFLDAAESFRTAGQGRLAPIAAIEAADCFLRAGETELAALTLGDAKENSPEELSLIYIEADEFVENDRAALVAARVAKSRREWKAVVGHAARAAEFNTRNREAHGLLALGLQHLGRNAEAAEHREYQRMLVETNSRAREVQAMLDADPDNPHLRCDLAEQYINGISLADAEVHLHEVLQTHPNFARAHALLARLYAEKATKDSAYRSKAMHHLQLAERGADLPVGDGTRETVNNER